MKDTPRQAKIYFLLAAVCMLLPSLFKLYTGETQQFVVASGRMDDPNFEETVVFMVYHGLEGATGIVINRPLPADEIERIPKFLQGKDLPLFKGGPVAYPDNIVILERVSLPDGTSELRSADFDDEIAKNPDYLQELSTGLKNGSRDARIYLGYAGWGTFQLENEFRLGAWASTPFEISLAFYEGEPKDVWLKALASATEKRKPRNPGMI